MSTPIRGAMVMSSSQAVADEGLRLTGTTKNAAATTTMCSAPPRIDQSVGLNKAFLPDKKRCYCRAQASTSSRSYAHVFRSVAAAAAAGIVRNWDFALPKPAAVMAYRFRFRHRRFHLQWVRIRRPDDDASLPLPVDYTQRKYQTTRRELLVSTVYLAGAFFAPAA